MTNVAPTYVSQASRDAAQNPKPTQDTFVYANGATGQYLKYNLALGNLSTFTPSFSTNSGLATPLGGGDADGDGLPDTFENQLADLFTPAYHVSGGEQPGTSFATFFDSVPQTVAEVFGPNPPRSYFRVTPMGFATLSGTQYGFLRIDYLTLWNRDDGLAVSTSCRLQLALALGLVGIPVGQILDGIADHPLDNERSAVLVAAPTPSPSTYSFDPNAYRIWSIYSSAHENTFTDQSMYFFPDQPIPGPAHVLLGLSRAKHATYFFNPERWPLIPPIVRNIVYATITDLWLSGIIDDLEYLAYLFAADTAFFSCIVDHFQEQGIDQYAEARTNVGEPNQPINGCHFIQDPNHLYPVLLRPLWQLN